ncbi:MAG: DsbA family protein [Candidatus Pacebacteria bacterium]|nr:DsbA family protein [Candidatus Paceibacterota bacterium]
MSNQSRKKKKIKNGVIIGLIVLLVVAFFVSQNSNKVNPETFANVEVSEPSAHLKGNLESEIKLIEYSDFQCPACSAVAPQVQKLVDDFGDKFQLEYRHFPLRSIHPNAQIAAQAAEAAGIQGKFWEMHDKLFENQAEWSKSFNPKKYLKQYAEEVGINVDRFTFDLESVKVKEIVNAQYKEAETLQLPGTPAFVFNGEKIDINSFINDNLIEKEEVSVEVVE